MKFVFPVLWIGGFSIATFGLFLSPGSWQSADSGTADSDLKWFFLLITIVGTFFIWWSCVRLKRIRMDARALYISNYSTEIVVPLVNGAEVAENRWLNIHPVTIRFYADSEFGSQVTFMPKRRWFAFWSSHPVVTQIRAAVDRATGRDRP